MTDPDEAFDRAAVYELERARETAQAERSHRAAQSDEADRRGRVRTALARTDLYALLEPPNAAIEQEENALTERLIPGMTLETAFAAEMLDLSKRGLVPVAVSPLGVARRLFEAYDEESAGRVRDLPESLLTAERVYAHLASLGGLGAALPDDAVRTLARRATILLYNRRWLAQDGPVRDQAERARADQALRGPYYPIPDPAPVPGPDDEDLLCVDCGRALAPGSECQYCCTKTVSPAPAQVLVPPRGTAPPERRPEPAPREKPYADRILVVDPHGLTPRGMPAEEPEQEQRRAEPRVVTGYARVTTDLVFATKDPSTVTGRGADVVLRTGAVIELMEPSPMDVSDIKKKAEEGVQLVTVRWAGKVRLVRGAVLEPASRQEWEREKAQDPRG